MRIIFIFLILICSFSSFAQEREENTEKEVNQERLKQRTMLDDSTKIIYGMKTTSYIDKDNFHFSDTIFNILDSTLNNIYDISRNDIFFKFICPLSICIPSDKELPPSLFAPCIPPSPFNC